MRYTVCSVAVLTISMGMSVTIFGQSSTSISPSKVYRVPFESQNNVIELNIVNTNSSNSSELTVTPVNVPEWITITPSSLTLQFTLKHTSMDAKFTYSVDRSAPTNEDHPITIAITSSSSQKWSKEYRISVSPPEVFTLYHNYPNPFNPATTISYTLPTESRVIIKIINILGQEVSRVVDDQRSPGYNEEVWDASAYPSGVYFYELTYFEKNASNVTARKRLTLVK